METQCKNIRKEIKSITKKLYLDQLLTRRLHSLSNMILRVSDTNLNSKWTNVLIDKCEIFRKELYSSDRDKIDIELTELEQETLNSLITDLQIPANQVNSIYANARLELKNVCSLDELLPKFLTLWLNSTYFTQNIVSQIDGDEYFKPLFFSFRIPYNNFVKQVAKRELTTGGGYYYNSSDLNKFLSLFFGPIENYKFYVKAARIIENSGFNNAELGLNFRYQITLTASNKNYTGKNQVIQEAQSFMVEGSGIQSPRFRSDCIVLFGRHQDADIKFPYDDTSADFLTCILINALDNVFVIDVSKKTKCGIKLENNKEYLLARGQLISMAKTVTFIVDSVEFKDAEIDLVSNTTTIYDNYDNFSQTSEVILSFIEGAYKDQKFRVSSIEMAREKNSAYILGCGGGGVTPSLFIPRETGVSRNHVSLVYKQEELSWYFIDMKSLNGTYFLFKNLTQFEQKIYSFPKPVFENLASYTGCTIMVGRYIFFLMIQ